MWLSALDRKQRETLLGLAHNVVVSDGLLDPNEELMIAEFKREMDLSPSIETDYVELEGIERVFDTQRLRRIVLINLIRLSYADGALEIEEECLLREVAVAFAVPPSELDRLDNWVKRLVALEQEAQAFL